MALTPEALRRSRSAPTPGPANILDTLSDADRVELRNELLTELGDTIAVGTGDPADQGKTFDAFTLEPVSLPVLGGSVQVLSGPLGAAFGGAVRPPTQIGGGLTGATFGGALAAPNSGQGEPGPPGPAGPAGGGTKHGLLDGAPMVATGLARLSNGLKAGGASARVRHVATTDGADLRLWYGGGAVMSNLYDPKLNAVRFKVGLEFPDLGGDAIIPVTFGGKSYGELDPYGAPVRSDPIPVEVSEGDVFFSRVYVYTPFGPTVTLAAEAAIGASTLQLSSLPRATGWALLNDSNPEWVEIVGYSGASAPFTAILASPVTGGTGTPANHPSGRTLGQQVLFTTGLRVDLDEGYALEEDLAHSGAFDDADLTLGGTVLTADAAEGDTIIQVGTQQTQFMAMGPLIVGNGHASQETRGLRSVQAGARIHLSEPLENAHATGQTVSSTVLSNRYGLAPTAITADRTTGTRRPGLVAFGDSIMRGAGTLLGLPLGFIDRAADAAPIALLNAGRNADQADEFVDGLVLTYNLARRQLLTAGDILVTHWSNDVGEAGSVGVLLARHSATWALARERGMTVAACTILPRSRTNDFGMSIEGQTTDTGLEPIRVPFNETLRGWVETWEGPLDRFGRGCMGRVDQTSDGYLVHGLTWVLDIAHAIESAVNSGLWRVDAGPLSDYIDIPSSSLKRMVHPTPGESGGNALIASYLDLTLLEA